MHFLALLVSILGLIALAWGERGAEIAARIIVIGGAIGFVALIILGIWIVP